MRRSLRSREARAEPTVRKLHFALAIVTLMLAASASARGESIRIAAEDDWAPYSAIKPDKSGPEGFAVDLVREVFKTKAIEVELVVMPFSRCMRDAEVGLVTGCFDATITSDNKSRYHWHKTPLFHEGLAIFGRSSETRTDLSVDDLHGKAVGVTNGYTYPTEFMEDERIQKVTTTSDANLLQMLVAGRVEYILINTMPGYLRAGQDPEVRGKVKQVGMVSMDGFWIAFSKIDPKGEAMATLFEQALTDFIRSGRYQEMETAFRERLGM